MKKTYRIEVDCANCALKMEDTVKKTPGVKDATVNYMAQKLTVEFDEGQDISSVMKDVCRQCKRVDDDFVIFL